MHYQRQTMLRVIAHDNVLSEIYLGYCKQMPIDDALMKIYKERMENTPLQYYRNLWEQLEETEEENEPEYIGIDYDLLSRIRNLVNEVGWRSFISAVCDYTDKKRKEMIGVGLLEASEVWKQITDRLGPITRRRVKE